MIDGDRALDSGEKEKLKKLVNYCINENISKRTPHILIVNYPNFEYAACLHCECYRDGDTEKFILEKLKYRSIDEFKSDKDVYVKLNSGRNSYKNISIDHAKRNSIIKNNFFINKSTFEIFVKTTFEEQNIGKRGSNFCDFYDVVNSL